MVRPKLNRMEGEVQGNDGPRTFKHHCDVCKGAMKPRCFKKCGLWLCEQHKWPVRENWDCVKCEAEEAAAQRREKHAKGEEQEDLLGRSDELNNKSGKKNAGGGRRKS